MGVSPQDVFFSLHRFWGSPQILMFAQKTLELTVLALRILKESVNKRGGEGQRDRERETETETNRQTGRQRDRQRGVYKMKAEGLPSFWASWFGVLGKTWALYLCDPGWVLCKLWASVEIRYLNYMLQKYWHRFFFEIRFIYVVLAGLELTL